MTQRNRTYLKALWIKGYTPSATDFSDLFDSFMNLMNDAIPCGSVAVTPVATQVTFDTSLEEGTSYEILPYCYDGQGNQVAFQITARSLTGFTVTATENATFVYQILIL